MATPISRKTTRRARVNHVGQHNPVHSVGEPKSQRVLHLASGGSVQLKDHTGALGLGRNNGNSVRFKDLTVSGEHALLQEHEGALWLRDLGSTNGTYLDGQLISREEWKMVGADSQISLGRNPDNLISLSSQKRAETDLRNEARASNGQTFSLPAEGSELSFGRSTDSDQVVAQNSPAVSRRHLVLRRNAGSLWVKDVGSSHGTFVSDSREAIPPGRWVELGDGDTLNLANQLTLDFRPSQIQQASPSQLAPQNSQNQVGQELKLLSFQESESILERAQIAESPLGRAMGAPDLSVEFLKDKGFTPQMSLQVGDKKIHVSKPYDYAGRPMMVGFVENEKGEVKVRSFYRSSSHALWKVASHAGHNGWFGKGMGQESVTLPLELQEAFSNLPKAEGTEKKLAESLFYGALELGGHIPSDDFQRQSEIKRLNHKNSASPEGLHLDEPGDQPDLQGEKRSFEFQANVQGRVKATVVSSQNKELDYMFCQDDKGRTWLGAVFSRNSQVSDFGVRRECIESGSLTSPAIDYGQEIPEGYRGEHVQGNYYEATAYTEKIPLVAAFKASQRGKQWV